jgi:hypothetical protein
VLLFRFGSFELPHSPTLICIHAMLKTKKEAILTSIIVFFSYTVT